jgi:hypothetical protein
VGEQGQELLGLVFASGLFSQQATEEAVGGGAKFGEALL